MECALDMCAHSVKATAEAPATAAVSDVGHILDSCTTAAAQNTAHQYSTTMCAGWLVGNGATLEQSVAAVDSPHFANYATVGGALGALSSDLSYCANNSSPRK